MNALIHTIFYLNPEISGTEELIKQCLIHTIFYLKPELSGTEELIKQCLN